MKTPCAVTIALLLAYAPMLGAQVASNSSARIVRAAPRITTDEQFARMARDSASSLAMRGDTAGAVKVLRSATERASKNAALWHDYGMILYEWTRPHWRVAPMPNGVAGRIIAAESSLARAMILEPDSIQYTIDYARNLFAANATSLRMAERAQRGALEAAVSKADTAHMVDVADHLGTLVWRRYDMDAEEIGEGMRGVGMTLNPKSRTDAIAGGLRQGRSSANRPAGEALYQDAHEYFRFVFDLAPDDERGLRHLAMVYAKRWRWDEVDAIARERIRLRPAQSWPWLVLGLAEQRRGKYVQAEDAFRQGFMRMDSLERDHLFSMSRLLRETQAKWFDTLPAAAKLQLDEIYWNKADPSLLMAGNPLRTEFYARVVYADVMWTDDELKNRGADSDKGLIQTRWGMPEFEGPYVRTPFGNFSTWVYTSLGASLRFRQSWGYGTAVLDGSPKGDMHHLNDRSLAWNNIPIMKRGIDSIDVDMARFRGDQDSLDIYLSTTIPVGKLRSDVPTESSKIRNAVFTIGGAGAEPLSKRVDTLVVTGHDPGAMYSVVRRLIVPVSVAAIRAEALEPDLERVARGVVEVYDFEKRGFGLSDLLVAAKITAPANIDDARWHNFAIEPMRSHVIKRGATVDLLWETYGLSSSDGSAREHVDISVERIEGKGVVVVGARLLNEIRGALNVGARSSARNDALSISFDRTSAPKPLLVEWLRIGLQDARVGNYRITLTVTDLATGASATRVRTFGVIDR